MSIAKILEQHDALVAEAGKAARFGAVTSAQLSRPVELQEQRAAAIKQRIEALQASKQDHAQRVDEAIKALRSDLAGLEKKIATDRKALAPALEAMAAGRGAEAGPKNSPAKRSSKAAPANARGGS
jgi:DNA-binding transcriptional MerR regulator